MRKPHKPFPSVWTLALLLILLIPLSLGLRRLAPPSTPLADALEAILTAPATPSAFWGIYVQDLSTGEVLFEHQADKAFVPASNQKLLTTATALDALGSDYRFETMLFLDGQITGSILKGDLILRGSGDPTFGSLHFQKPDPLLTWAVQLAEQGVKTIEGRILGDDDLFEDQSYAMGWDVSHLASESFAVAKSGLSYHDNRVRVRLEATQAGRAPLLTTEPADYLEIQNQLTTSARPRGPLPAHERSFGTETVRFSGTVPQSYRGSKDIPVANPTSLALHAFRQHLRAVGIQVNASLHDCDALNQKPNYTQAKPLFTHTSPPLSEIIRLINKESNNFFADQVFHTFAWGGTTEGGSRRIKEVLARHGVDVSGMSIYDGSGLSRRDLITPQAMGQLLAHMARHPESTTFDASLPRGDEGGTTLQGRLGGIPVRAKTGSLDGVRTLSGYVTTQDGRTLVFAIFANHFTTPAHTVMKATDNMVQVLASAPWTMDK